MFSLYNNVIRQASKVRFKEIDAVRKSLLQNFELIDVTDFKSNTNQRKTISSVARSSLSQKKFASFLYLLANFLQANSILETGTSLGITTAYLGKSKARRVVSLEGSPIMHQLAKKILDKLDSSVNLVLGDIHHTFTRTLALYKPDFIFLDADHRGSSTQQFVEEILEISINPKCIVIHDIYWSKDMTLAWHKLKEDPRFKLTIDIFQAGILFPNWDAPKQHFVVRF